MYLPVLPTIGVGAWIWVGAAICGPTLAQALRSKAMVRADKIFFIGFPWFGRGWDYQWLSIAAI
jgi:hypothetical protein